MARSECVLASDVGGTTLDGAIINSDIDIVGPVCSAATEQSLPRERLLAKFRGALGQLAAGAVARDLKVIAAGYGFPAPFDYIGPTEGTSRMEHKFRAIQDVNLKEILEADLNGDGHDVRVYFDNDAAVFSRGVSLKHFRGRRVPRRLAGATIGTGIGAAGGDVDDLHDFDIWDKPYNGMTVEDYVSARAVMGYYQAFTHELVPAEEIARRAREGGDRIASRAYHALGKHLGLSFAQYVAHEDPEVIVCGGNVAKSFDLFGSTAAASYYRATGERVPFEATLLPHLALYGAAAYAFARRASER